MTSTIDRPGWSGRVLNTGLGAGAAVKRPGVTCEAGYLPALQRI